jgi:ComEC/Rec2-related protein
MTIGIKWLIFCAALALGEATSFTFPFLYPAGPVVLAAGALGTLFAFGCAWRFWPLIGVFSVGAFLGWNVFAERNRAIVEMVDFNGGRPTEAVFAIPASVKCHDAENGKRKVVFPGKVRGVDVMVNLFLKSGDAVPRPGETWACEGWMGRDSYGGTWGRRSFWVRGKGSSARRIDEECGVTGIDAFVARSRADFSRRIGIGVDNDDETEVLNRALFLGVRSEIDSETREVFAASGTAHLFAVSGLHVLVVAKFFSVLLSFTGFPSRFKALVLIPLIWFYVLVVGAGPSAVRAGMMASFCWSAALFWRKSDSLAAWAQTFAVVHIAFPEMLLNTGSQLSFAVMLGLVLWNNVAKGLKGRFIEMFAPTAVAWVFGVPIVAATFAVITPGGLLSNLLAVPIAVFSVVFTASGVVSSYVSDFLAGVFNSAAHLSTSIVLGLARVTSAVEWSNFEIERWTFSECALWYCVVAFAFWLINDWLRRPKIRI